MFPRSQHTCLYIYIDQKWIYIKLYSASSRFETLFKSLAQLFTFKKKGPPVAILDVQKSLLTISDQYHHFILANITKWLLVAILDVQNSLSMVFLAISDQYETYFFNLYTKWPCPKFTFDRISGHFRSILNFFLKFLQNGRRRPFWMSEIHFWLNFWPFQIDAQLLFFLVIFDKMAVVGHFGCPKFTFDCISGNFRSIQIFFLKFFTKWPPADFFFRRPFWKSENHFWLHFWSIGHFGCPKFTFDGISGLFRSIRILIIFKIFDKTAAGVHFGCPKITFDRISGHFRSISNFFFEFLDKMTAGGHFGWDDNVNYRTRPRYLDE